jgi:hypothetical protein
LTIDDIELGGQAETKFGGIIQQLGRGESGLEKSDRLSYGTAADCLVSRGRGVLSDQLSITGFGGVVGESRLVLVATSDELINHLSVQALSPNWRHRGLDRASCELMAKAKLAILSQKHAPGDRLIRIGRRRLCEL